MSEEIETEQVETVETEQVDDGDTFPRKYVEELRQESKGYRDRANAAEAQITVLQQRLHTALVTNSGRLADPTDLEFNAEHLEDADTLTASIDALLEQKPHLKARTVGGSIGQGISGSKDEPFSLLSTLKTRV